MTVDRTDPYSTMTEFQPPYFPPPFPGTATSLSSVVPPQPDVFQQLSPPDPYNQHFQQTHTNLHSFSYDSLRRDYHRLPLDSQDLLHQQNIQVSALLQSQNGL